MDIHDKLQSSEDEASQSPEDELSPEEQKEQQREVLKVMMNFKTRTLELAKMTINFRNFLLKTLLVIKQPLNSHNNVPDDKEVRQFLINWNLVEGENSKIFRRIWEMQMKMTEQYEEENFEELVHSICEVHKEFDMQKENLRAFVLTFGGPEDWKSIKAMETLETKAEENMDVDENHSDVESSSSASSSSFQSSLMEDSGDLDSSVISNLEDIYYCEREE